jgi:hypothetical protein
MRPYRHNAARTLAGALFLLVPAVAHAELAAKNPAEEDPAQRPVVSERRNGVVLGFAAGAGLAGASGYPNDVKFIGNPDFYSQSTLLAGYSLTWFLMGALTDYLNVGPFVNVATFESDRWKSTGAGGGLRAEVFPLINVCRCVADIALYGQVGFGATTLRANGPYPTADATSSFIGLGVHDEFRLARFLGGHVAAGPFLEYDVIRASNAERHWMSGGLRLAWYGGKVTLDSTR